MGNEQSDTKSSGKGGASSRQNSESVRSHPRGKLMSASSLQYDSPTRSTTESSSTGLTRRSASAKRASSSHSRVLNPSSLNPQSYAGSKTPREIVVVREGVQSNEEAAPELKQLSEIPVFGPLLRNSSSSGPLGSSSSSLKSLSQGYGAADFGERLDHRAIHHICCRYQEHLKVCSEAIAFDQNSLCNKMKEVDNDIKNMTDALTERQKKYARYSEQLIKVQEMRHVLIRVSSTTNTLVQMMEQMNALLPPDQQLEPFSFLPDTKPCSSSALPDTKSSSPSGEANSKPCSSHGDQAQPPGEPGEHRSN